MEKKRASIGIDEASNNIVLASPAQIIFSPLKAKKQLKINIMTKINILFSCDTVSISTAESNTSYKAKTPPAIDISAIIPNNPQLVHQPTKW
jgi:hypothetical protein